MSVPGVTSNIAALRCVPLLHADNNARFQPSRYYSTVQRYDLRCSATSDKHTFAAGVSEAKAARLERRHVLALVLVPSLLQALEARAHSELAGAQLVLGELAAGEIDGGVTTLLPTSAAASLTPSGKQILEFNKRLHKQNGASTDFPYFVRQGFSITVMADGYVVDDQGLIYKDYEEGSGVTPTDGQEVSFHYVAYNESGSRIDSSYNKGRPASTRLGIKGMIPGFEQGIKTMKVGGKRRLVVPPELGPPVGPSTFFSAKQCEVFDVELLGVKNCRRRQVAMFSDVVCE